MACVVIATCAASIRASIGACRGRMRKSRLGPGIILWNMANAWDYNTDYDTPESFPYFVAYRDSQHRVLTAARLGVWDHGACTRTTPAQLRTWYISGHWKERVAAYDAHMDVLQQEERECIRRKTVAELEHEHKAILAMQTEIVSREMAKLASEVQGMPDSRSLSVYELRAMAEGLIKNSRLVAGEATERIESTVDLSKLTDEELAAYGALLSKARGA